VVLQMPAIASAPERFSGASGILAVQQVPNCSFSLLIEFLVGAAGGILGAGSCLRFAARRTTIGKTRLTGLQFKLLGTDHANFYRKGTCSSKFNGYPKIINALKVSFQVLSSPLNCAGVLALGFVVSELIVGVGAHDNSVISWSGFVLTATAALLYSVANPRIRR
jgi:hypothetical protein